MTVIDVGSVLGPVELKSVLRKDETSTVFSGHHARLNAEVTLRVMYGCPDEDRPRFLREARITATLKHPALVRVLDFGEFGPARYIVTQPIRGTTLEHYLAEHKEPPSELAILQLLLHVADTLRVCHAGGVAHRDLRPSSLLRDLKGRLKVLDFGLVPSSGGPSRAPDGSFAGASPYLPPEYAHCETPIPPSADVFALGVIAYKLAFQCLPYDPDEMARENAEELPASARFDLPTHCSDEFLAIVRDLIHPEPSARIATAPALLERLRAHSMLRVAASKSVVRTPARRAAPVVTREAPMDIDAAAVSLAPEPTRVRTDPGSLARVPSQASTEAVARPLPAERAWGGNQLARLAQQAVTEIGQTLRAAFNLLADQRHEVESLPAAIRRRLLMWGIGITVLATSVVATGVTLLLH